MTKDLQPVLKCGVAGVGYLGQHHARIYAEIAEGELCGVYDPDTSRAKSIAAKHGGAVFESLAELGAACDVVSVVTPTNTHFGVAMELLDCGCHLLIEKPICDSLDEARAISERAAEVSRVVQIGHIEHFNPVMDYLEERVSDPRFITADRLAPFKDRGIEVSVVLDLMIHDIGIVLQLVRSPLRSVQAVGVNVLTPSIDLANVRLEFESGCVANLNASRVSLKAVREIRVFQPDLYLSLNFAEQKGHTVEKGLLPLKPPANLIKRDIPIEKAEPLKVELRSFINAVRRRTRPRVSVDLGITALEVALRVMNTIEASRS